MTEGPRLIAFGGGGATNGTDPELEDHLFHYIERRHGVIGYCGAASGGDPEKFDRLAWRLAGFDCLVTLLPSTADAREAADWVGSVDAVYFGGGHSGRLVEYLRLSGCGTVFMEAARKGLLIAGVSAGALCWFDCVLSDAGGSGLAPFKGLGLFSGSLCPHYSTEPERRRLFPDFVGSGLLPGGVAIDDGVGVLFRPDADPVAFAAREGCWAYAVSADGAGGAIVRNLAAAPCVAAR